MKPFKLTMLVTACLLAQGAWAADGVSSASKKVDGHSQASKQPTATVVAQKTTPARATVAELSLIPNTYSFINRDAKGIVYNGHAYEYDTTSGATVLPSRKVNPKSPMDPQVKAEKMYWTAEPPLGLIEGEYYGLRFDFPHRDLTFSAYVDCVVDKGRIVHIEMDEQLDPRYYDKYWAGSRKRRSGYTFFQQSKGRTDDTLVTWANGITFLEYQVLKHNSLNIPFDTVYGSSNSARDAFIPAVGKLNAMVDKPSDEYYIGLTEPLANGVLARLQLVFKGKTIRDARYDEIFPDTPADIKDEKLKKYFRTSKYEGLAYKDDFGPGFRTFADQLTKAIVEKNSLQVDLPNAPAEMANYERLAKDLQPAIERYLKTGYQHNIGAINQRPKDLKVNPINVSRKGDIEMKVVKQTYDEKTSTMTLSVNVKNLSKAPYDVWMKNFYMYALLNKTYDTVGSMRDDIVAVKPGEETVLAVPIKPIYAGDKDLNLKYDGPNKIYFEMPIER